MYGSVPMSMFVLICAMSLVIGAPDAIVRAVISGVVMFGLFFVLGLAASGAHFWARFLLPLVVVFVWGRRRDIYIVAIFTSILITATFWLGESAAYVDLLANHVLPAPDFLKQVIEIARQIATNAGEDGSVIVGKILEKDQYSFGFDAQNAEYGNMLTKGIIDPTKVVRAAIQNAASVAGLLITTEAMVAELPKKASAAPAMPGGGMGGMDF